MSEVILIPIEIRSLLFIFTMFLVERILSNLVVFKTGNKPSDKLELAKELTAIGGSEIAKIITAVRDTTRYASVEDKESLPQAPPTSDFLKREIDDMKVFAANCRAETLTLISEVRQSVKDVLSPSSEQDSDTSGKHDANKSIV